MQHTGGTVTIEHVKKCGRSHYRAYGLHYACTLSPPASGECLPQQAKCSSARRPESTRATCAHTRARGGCARTTPLYAHTRMHAHAQKTLAPWRVHRVAVGALEGGGACCVRRPADFRGRDRFALFTGRRSTLRVARQAALRLAHLCVLCLAPRPLTTRLLCDVQLRAVSGKSKSISFPKRQALATPLGLSNCNAWLWATFFFLPSLRIGAAAPPRRQALLQGANANALQEDLAVNWGG